MRKIKNKVFLCLALLPIVAYLLTVFRTGSAESLLSTLEVAFGGFGAFFEPLLAPLFLDFVALTDSSGVALVAWFIGYYVVLLFGYLVFSLFTFLVTLFMDKIDKMKGV